MFIDYSQKYINKYSHSEYINKMYNNRNTELTISMIINNGFTQYKICCDDNLYSYDELLDYLLNNGVNKINLAGSKFGGIFGCNRDNDLIDKILRCLGLGSEYNCDPISGKDYIKTPSGKILSVEEALDVCTCGDKPIIGYDMCLYSADDCNKEVESVDFPLYVNQLKICILFKGYNRTGKYCSKHVHSYILKLPDNIKKVCLEIDKYLKDKNVNSNLVFFPNDNRIKIYDSEDECKKLVYDNICTNIRDFFTDNYTYEPKVLDIHNVRETYYKQLLSIERCYEYI